MSILITHYAEQPLHMKSKQIRPNGMTLVILKMFEHEKKFENFDFF